MDETNKFTAGTRMNRPSYESKISLTLPNTSNNSNSNTSNTSNNNGNVNNGINSNSTSSSSGNTDIDFSLLDYKSVDDFLYYSNTKNDIQHVSNHLAKQLKASRSLLSLSKFLIFGNNPRELVSKIVDSSSAIIDAERVLFLELDQETSDLIYFKPQESSSETMFRIRDGVEYEVVLNHRPVVINNAETETKYNSILYQQLRIQPRNIVCVPVIFSDKIAGVLLALNKLSQDLTFSQFDVSCLQSIAANIAILMRQAALNLGQIDIRISRSPSNGTTEETSDHIDYIPSSKLRTTPPLKQVTSSIEASSSSKVEFDSNTNNALVKLIEEASQELHADKISLFIPQTPSKLKCVISPDILGFEIPSNQGIVGDTYTSSRKHSIANAKNDPRHYSEIDKLVQSETMSLLSYPILINGGGGTTQHDHYSQQTQQQPQQQLYSGSKKVVGVIQAINKRDGHHFTEEDEKYMSNICSRIADLFISMNSSSKYLNGTQDNSNNVSNNNNMNNMNTSTTSTTSTNTISSNTSSSQQQQQQQQYKNIFQSLGEFSSLLNRMEDTNYLNNLLHAISCYGCSIGDCDEVISFSVTSSEDSSIELLSINNLFDQSKKLLHSSTLFADLITTSSRYSSIILNILKSKQITEETLELTSTESQTLGINSLNILVMPLSYHSNHHLTSYLKGKSIDVIVAFKKKVSSTVNNVFSSIQKEGLTSLIKMLSPSLSLYGIILEKKITTENLMSLQSFYTSTLNRLGVMSFIISSLGTVVISSRSWQRFLGVSDEELKKNHLKDIVGDRCPVFMIDIKECMRSHTSIDRKNVRLYSKDYSNGVLVNYDIHEYKNTSHVLECSGNNSFFRVIITVLSHTEFNCDESGEVSSDNTTYEIIHSNDNNKEGNNKQSRDMRMVMKSTPDAQTLKSPRQFTINDATEIERLFTWEFNVLNIVEAAARRYCIIACLEKDLNLGMLNISRNQLAAFVAEVEKNYRLNPFHNFFHAVCVTHFISMLMRDTSARLHINNDLMYFSMMSSAVVHDVDHPGNTNLFEINSCSELALLYNDIGVLENHHCATAFRIMKLPGLDIFGQLNFAQKSLARKTIISCIMATDMALHVGLVEQMAARTGQPWNIDTPAEKLFYGKIILHSADLSNPVRPFYLSKEWACRVSEEFNRQGEMEKQRGLPVSTFLLTPDTKTLAKNEIYFSGQVVAPMWRSLAALFPTLQHLAIQIESNVESWKELLASLE